MSGVWVALDLALGAAGVVLVFRRCFWALLWVAIGLIAVAAGVALSGDPPGAAAALILAAWHLWLWWRRGRGQRKRVPKIIGAKARALREKLTRSMPRWSPRLQPQGARALCLSESS